MAHRSASARSIQCVTQRSPLHLRTSIVRTRPVQVYQARQLWWWSRSRNTEYPIDDEQERFLRHQKHIRNRYAKIIRRRAMWDRDPSPSPWPWQRKREERLFEDLNEYISNERVRNREHPGRQTPLPDDFKTFHKDFESFRKAVDRSVDRDPYGTLFGRRLWSPPSANNSSWTSFSWIFDPKEIKEEGEDPSMAARPTKSQIKPTVVPETPHSNSADPSHQPTPPATAHTSTIMTGLQNDVEYEYDPISMRKVPKMPSSPTMPPSEPPFVKPAQPHQKTSSPKGSSKAATNQPVPEKLGDSAVEPRRKTIFETLFAENAVDIPVKTYSPKVYGYNPKTMDEKIPDKKTASGRFETSRKREFQALKAATLGNTIDTTAEFFGKYTAEPAVTASSQTMAGGEGTKDVPFSGTTYERKADKLTGHSQRESKDSPSVQSPASQKGPLSAWLEKEGFTTGSRDVPLKGFNIMSSPKDNDISHDIPIQRYTGVEPSLSRLKSRSQYKVSRLQPSLDRSRRDTESSSRIAWEDKIVAAEKAEDIDLLRSSDVRASMKADRTTKQDIQHQKEAAREQLEKDFVNRKTESDVIQKPKRDSSSSLDHVWKHVEANKDGIVARTIRSMGAINENFKKYVRPANNLNEPLPTNIDSSVRTPTIYKPSRPLCIPTEPSKQVVDAMKEQHERISALQSTVAENKSRIALENDKLDKLAKEITGIYEDRYGKLNAANDTRRMPEPPTAHPLSTATIKVGVSTDPVIEQHIRRFEPTYARLVDDMKDVRRNLHETKLTLRDIRASLTKKSWSELEAARLSEYAQNRLVEEEDSAAGLDEPAYSEAKKEGDGNVVESFAQSLTDTEPAKRETYPKSFDEPVAAINPRTKMAADLRAQADIPCRIEKPSMEEPVFTPSGSPIWNDEQPPPISELKAALNEFTSPVVILVYDPSTKSVKAIPSPNLPTLAHKDNLNPFALLAGLDMAQGADFLSYFPKLQNAGYELVDGDKDKLIFRKPISTSSTARTSSAQNSTPSDTRQAATVLNEIPADIEPPGPSAPIPPPTSYPTSPTRAHRQPRVRRQETVFSGTTTAPTMPITSASTHSNTAPPPPPNPSASYDASYDYETQTPKPGFFSRLSSAVWRSTLIVFGLGAGAYATGVIAEGIGAQEQATQGISQADPMGPRKKIVLPQTIDSSENYRRGTRPGIYSTESSRRD
jgi:hypothetical protein